MRTIGRARPTGHRSIGRWTRKRHLRERISDLDAELARVTAERDLNEAAVRIVEDVFAERRAMAAQSRHG